MNKTAKYSFLFLFYPIVLLSIIVFIEINIIYVPVRMLFAYFLLYILAFYIPFKGVSAIYVSIIYFVTLILSFFESAYIMIYKERITTSTVFILIETNKAEVKEYLSEYFSANILLLAFLFIIPSIWVLVNIVKAIKQYTLKHIFREIYDDIKKLGVSVKALLKLGYYKLNTRYKIASVLFIIGFSLFFLRGDFYKSHIVYQFYEGFNAYKEELAQYEEFRLAEYKSPVIKSVQRKEDKQPETLVVVIGESTTRNHMGIYGYYRNTTPKLQMLQDELVVFNDVISPHTHTISSLRKVLTFGSTTNPEAETLGNMVNLVKSAGYKTYWISNQVPLGRYETLITMIAKSADKYFFINLGDSEKNQNSLDEKLLPFVERALEEDHSKKVIFVHLLGTHGIYNKRYPSTFNYFKDTPKTAFAEGYAVINSYDNAVLYNDFIISNCIAMLKESCKDDEVGLLYFSDHGEEVFQTMSFNGHTESFGTAPMFEIPFIYWTNQKSKLEEYRNYTDRRYMTDDLIYSVADLLDIKFDGMRYDRSIFNEAFTPYKRIVKGKINFDTELKTHN